jgi:Ca-activated chloride channel family protein
MLQTYHAEVALTDQVARVTIDQTFRNPNNRRMEGDFLFPLPRDSQISRFTLEINGKQVEAELLTAEKARNIYEDIVRKLKDPALLEYADQGVFKVRVYPIEPHGTRRIRLSYDQLLRATDGLCEFRLPLGAGRLANGPIAELSVEAKLRTQRDLKSIYCPSHKATLERSGTRQAMLKYKAENLTPEGDLQLFYATDADPVGVSLLAHRDGTHAGTFILLLSPGYTEDTNRIIPKDVVFVVDTSGSMAGGKLDQARKAMLFCVENLNTEDRFEVIRFSTEAEALFGQLISAETAHLTDARRFIERFKPMGGTAIDEALRRALAQRPRETDRPFVVIFLTDGRPTVGLTDEESILTRVREVNKAGTRVFCFGIGHDVNTHLLDKVTEATRSSSQYVLPEEDLEIKVSNFFARIKDPVLVEPSLQWGNGIRVTQTHPARLPDLFRGEQVIVAGRYEGKGEAEVKLVGTVNGKQQELIQEVTFPSRATDYDFVPRLWATRRVGYLLDEIRLHGDTAELRDEVIDLARRYGVVTPYTALLIVEDESRRGLTSRVQSLPSLQSNPQAVQDGGELARRMVVDRYGLGAVGRARSEDELKFAEAPALALRSSQLEAQRSFQPTPRALPPSQPSSIAATARPFSTPRATDTRQALQATAQQSQFVGGRTFFWNGDRWLDALVQQQRPGTPHQQITLASQEYFDLLRRNPEVRTWMSLGTQVDFVWNGQIIEIRE